ncbi:uncharacterized protein F5891DRAFT_1034244 [Suillus fuscotomentosus]|uniref:Uncharacterized protein n=1 Tax=Suillus fuscotomentosus TaxID=1912939 RepID=A0AAD4HJZ9_9AGAM|nr:uncharacterized protein F5891DRAFT_1034244 [Suillus fuscotomentosus]KAG1900465.1 hypothetical protein F5891DRAFT_1034244 [Suillus fuscotomentosus]
MLRALRLVYGYSFPVNHLPDSSVLHSRGRELHCFLAHQHRKDPRFTLFQRFNTGGDEINKNCYADDYPTQQQLKKTGMTLTVLLTRSHRSLMVH